MPIMSPKPRTSRTEGESKPWIASTPMRPSRSARSGSLSRIVYSIAARPEGRERLAELPSPGGAQRAHRPRVESPHRGDDSRPAGRGPRELDRGLDRLGTGIAQEDSVQVPRGHGEQFLDEGRLGIGPERRADVDELLGLTRNGLDDRGVAVAEIPDAEGGPAIDVLMVRVVPQRRHRSAHEGELSLGRTREFDGPRVRGAQEITVPMPSRARSTGSGCKEEAMTTRGTPPSSASPAAINFFFIRPYAKSMNWRRRARGTSRINVEGSLGSRSRPGTFVSRTRASASIATATWAAIRSASALISSPWGVTPGGEITGTYPASKRSRIKVAFTRSTVPEWSSFTSSTRPLSTERTASLRRPVRRPPSTPLRPTAGAPRDWRRATIVVFSFPVRAIVKTSIVSRSVYRDTIPLGEVSQRIGRPRASASRSTSFEPPWTRT